MIPAAPRVRTHRAVLRQERLLPFLRNPRSYPHRPRTVRLIQTHGAFVLIAPPWVYKLKKAVNFGFLDFSTLARRRHCLERELDLNRRLTREVYEGLVPITRTPGGFRWGGPGRPVEYALRMRLLCADGFLDRRLRRGAVAPGDVDRIADRMARFYREQRPPPSLGAAGRPARLRIATEENFRQTRRFIGRTLSEAAFETIREFTETVYRRRSRELARRVRDGWIRDGHGDLHLEHVHLTPDALNIYDCIEFNDRFRHLDVASDVAFLAMDLDFHGRPDLADRWVRNMARRLGDPGLTGLQDFYRCYRAYVRGKVESLHGEAHAATPRERAQADRVARQYFHLALRYSVAGCRPLVLVVMGRAASGKSTLAAGLEAELGWTRVASDPLRKRLAGVPLHHRGTAAERRRLYSGARTAATYRALMEAAVAEVRAGRSVILDATFSSSELRAALRRRCHRLGCGCCFIEARASMATVRSRLRARDGNTREVSDARLEDFDVITRRYQPPRELPAADRIAVATRGEPAEGVQRALQALARRQAAAEPSSR